MYRTMLERHLAEAEQNVVIGERFVADQRERVKKLENGGHNVTAARTLLGLFEDTQAIYVAARDRLRKQLAKVQH